MLTPVVRATLTAATAISLLTAAPGAGIKTHTHLASSETETVTATRAPAISGLAKLDTDNGQYIVTGTATSVPGATSIRVTLANAASWTYSTTTATAPDGTFTATLPALPQEAWNTSQPAVKVSVKRNGKTASAEIPLPTPASADFGTGTGALSTMPPAPTAPAGDPTAYTYTVTNASGQPATWNTCQPIRYQINHADMPDGAQAVIDAAFAYATQTTGITFVDGGPSENIAWPNGDGHATNAAPGTILIQFTDASQLPRLTGSVLALGGFDYETSDRQTITSAAIAIDLAEIGTTMPIGFGPGPTLGTTLIHELGHTLNLGHSSDPTQVMYPILMPTITGHFQAGDLAGLAGIKRTC